MINLRIAPSGPIVAQLGPGFVGRRAVENVVVPANEGSVAMPGDQSFSYLGEDGTAAKASTVELEECDPAKAYSFAMRVLVKGNTVTNSTAACTLRIEYSTNEGNTWETLKESRIPMRSGSGSCPTYQAELNADSIPGADLAGLALGGKLLTRASVNATSGAGAPYSNLSGFTWDSEGGGNARLEIAEVLPAE